MLTKRQTTQLKGIAVLMLMFHHLFLNSERAGNCYLFIGSIGRQLLIYTAIFGKVCVAIFLILSGYGISESSNKFGGGQSFCVNLRRIYKLMRTYWLILAVWLVILLAGLRIQFADLYPSFWDLLIDLTGLSYLFGTTTLNGAWWYMTAIIMAYLLFPWIRLMVRYSAKFTCAASAGLIAIFMIFFPTGGMAKNADFIIWLVPFMLGVIWSENKDKIAELKLSRKIWCLLLLVLLAMAFLRQLLHTYNFDAVIAIVMLALLLSVNFWQTGWI